ncbi:MAG: cupin domain-containing protein [Halioglobus sp.]|nr:cupin domain-containing protein [Halioglobus sp.]
MTDWNDAMKAAIKTYNAEQEYYFAEGCYINELSNSIDDPHVSIARARLAPGKTTRWHYLKGTGERYVIQEGFGVVEIQGLPEKGVNAGDVVLIPPGARQRICNTGADDLVFLAICSPPFTADVYIDADD